MPLIVDFKKRIGYYSIVGFDRKTYKNYFCESNSLCSMIHFRKDENGEKVADLMGVFADVKHAEKCIKSGYFENCGRFCFYAKEMNTDLWKMVRIMTENGIKVTIK
jgi:hypothetical protein